MVPWPRESGSRPTTEENQAPKGAMRKARFVEVGGWKTLEWFWGGQGTAVFLGPPRAQIKVRYGNGWRVGADRQLHVLDGLHQTELKVGWESVVYARMQMQVSRSAEVTYEFYPAARRVV
jgi:hypothetical protein